MVFFDFPLPVFTGRPLGTVLTAFGFSLLPEKREMVLTLSALKISILYVLTFRPASRQDIVDDLVARPPVSPLEAVVEAHHHPQHYLVPGDTEMRVR